MAYPHSFTLYDLLATNAARTPNGTALIHDGAKTSYGELLGTVDQLGSGLAREGLRRGARIGIVAKNSARFIQLLLACARQGIVAVPVNWRWQQGEIEQFLNRSNIEAIFYDADNEANALAAAPDTKFKVELHSDLEASSPAARGFLELLHRRLRPAPPIDADAPFCIIATAAVDVIPRGALLSHRNLLISAAFESAALQLSAKDGNLVNLPLFHIAGIGHLFAFLSVGAKNVMMPSFDADASVQFIDEHDLTYFATFPPILGQVLDAAKTAGSSLPTLRWVSGLEAPDTAARLHSETQASFLSGFGQCETTGFVTLQNTKDGPFCAGHPVDHCSLALFDDQGERVEQGEVGEIGIRGPLVFLGYDGQPEVNNYTFRNGWHHTGDLGKLDEEGRLHYAGRKPEKELIKPGGENVYPAEVETVLVQMSGVKRACVFGVPHEKWGEGIRAVLEVEDGVEIELDAAAAFVGERIARFKRPHSVVNVKALPESAAGIVDRVAVKAAHG